METKQYERSKSFRKVMKRTPGGKLTTYAERRKKKGKTVCEICGTKIKIYDKKSKTLANVCNKCMSRIAVLKAKAIEGAPAESIDLRYAKYVKKI